MIADLNPYPNYKESGEAWIGKIPKHWKILPNRAIFREINKRNNEGEEMLSVTITQGIIRQKALLINSSKKDSSRVDKSAYKLVCQNDIAYNKMRAWQGAIGVSEFRGIISPAYVVMRLREQQNARYFHYLYRTPHFAKEAERWSYGITSDMWSLRPEHFKIIVTPVPPSNEQATIVRYLDYATRRIERAIRAKRKLIAFLNEQKQIIIHQAVTRGLNPTAPLRNSGVDWIGEVPAHWEIRRIKYLLQEKDNRSTTGLETLLSMRMYHGLVPFAEHFNRPPQSKTLVGFKIVKPGQVVINRMQAGNGLIFASTLHGLVSPDYAVFDIIGDVTQDFIGELFRSRVVRAKFRSESKGLGTGTSGFMRLYNDRLGAIHIAVPPISEQKDIIIALNKNLANLNAAIDRTDREIKLLQEYLTRIIADIVTGQFDVREAVQHLPAEEETSLIAVDDTFAEDEEIDDLVTAEGDDE